MAQRTVVHLEDDIDGSEASETISFGLDGASYEIDLNEKNASELRDALAPYVAVSRRAGRAGSFPAPTQRRRLTARAETPRARAELDPKAVRAWAAEQGITVNGRGRIKAEVLEQYRAAH